MFKRVFSIVFLTTFLTTAQAESSTPIEVLLTTDLGDIRLELYPDKAPVTVENFVNYVQNQYYDGLIFHRVIQGFMIQAGGYTPDLSMREPSGSSIINESTNGLKNEKGTIAMARQTDPNSAKAQFFINVVPNWSLNARNGQPGYTVFGKVIQGTNVADKISRIFTQAVGPFANLPETPVRIIKAEVVDSK